MKPSVPDLKRYCLHGLGLSVIMFGLIFGWTFVLAILMAIGSVLGLLIGMGLLILGLGYVNAFLAEYVWTNGGSGGQGEVEERFRLEGFREGAEVDYGWTSLDIGNTFFHGLILLIFLGLVNIPYVAIQYLVPHWAVTLALIIVYVPIHGYVGATVAGYV